MPASLLPHFLIAELMDAKFRIRLSSTNFTLAPLRHLLASAPAIFPFGNRFFG